MDPVYLRNDESIWIFDPNNRNISILNDRKSNIDQVQDVATFWVDEKSAKIKSFSRRYRTVKYPKSWKPKAIAVDLLNYKIYAIDSVKNSLNVIDMHSMAYKTLITSLPDPQDLVVDPARGLMFILTNGSVSWN